MPDLDAFLDNADGDAGDGAQNPDPKDGTGSSADKGGSTEKRIRDLQSKADQETARANKLAKELEDLKKGSAGSGVSGVGAGAAAASVPTDYLDYIREMEFNKSPVFADFEMTAADLNGSTAAEIKAHAAELSAKLAKFQTKATNRVLAEHGHAPELNGGTAPATRDFRGMPDEEFNKLVDQARRGMVPR